MPAQIKLTVTQGPLALKEFVFDEYSLCLIGRAPDCQVRLPDDEAHRTISRHHCLIEINPPQARVRDFGSLNGTSVNGRRIGSRQKGQSPEEAARENYPQIDLADGDEIGLGGTIFRVGIRRPVFCVKCGIEIKIETPGPAGPAPEPLCPVCQVAVEKNAPRTAPPGPADPLEIVRQLLGVRPAPPAFPSIPGLTLIRELGRGGMGAVFLARETATGREIAIKIMRPEVESGPQARARFQREAEVTRALKHPHIVELYDLGVAGGAFYFTLEYCPGGSVADLIRDQGGRLPMDRSLALILPALDALEYAHGAPITIPGADGRPSTQLGVIHRDLKPGNIFLSGTPTAPKAKIADFGLAKSFQGAGLSGLTATGTAAGSPWFMPRQQVIRFKHAKPEVDVWAMAASLYVMLTGQLPRNFPPGRDPWHVVLDDAPIPIRQRTSQIPIRLAEVIDQALVDRPEITFKTALALKRALMDAIR